VLALIDCLLLCGHFCVNYHKYDLLIIKHARHCHKQHRPGSIRVRENILQKDRPSRMAIIPQKSSRTPDSSLNGFKLVV
jgi:hypothetical protein